MVKTDTIAERMQQWFDSEEGKKEIEKYVERQKLDKERNERWYGYFHNIGKDIRNEFIEKVIRKYNSDEYYNRYIKRGLMPEEMLYSFIYGYAKEYGKEWNFTYDEAGPGADSKYVFDDWTVLVYVGQGCKIIVRKTNADDMKAGEVKIRPVLDEERYMPLYYMEL